MKKIPPDLEYRFNILLDQESVNKQIQIEYQKWLRYYLDFCQKYSFVQSDQNSLVSFINKLREKKTNGPATKSSSPGYTTLL